MGRTRLAVIVAAIVTAIASVAAVAAAVSSSDDDAAPASTAVSTPEGTATAPSSDAAAIEIKDFAFGPAELTVAAGTEVVWTNADGVTHTVQSDDGSFVSPDLADGDSYSFTFTTPGTYPYTCGIHDSMKGTIIVTG